MEQLPTKSPKRSKKHALESAKALVAGGVTSRHIEAYFKEAYRQKNDRAAALAISANTETTLQYAISRRLAISYYDQKIFGNEAPLSTFDKKIKMAVALRIIGPETERALNLIRTIRNFFAHSATPITFKTEEIKDVCEFLSIPETLYPKAIKMRAGKIVDPRQGVRTARKKFTLTCDTILHNLLMNANNCPQKPKSDPSYLGQELWLKPLSLPQNML
jgi:hypothetical protein